METMMRRFRLGLLTVATLVAPCGAMAAQPDTAAKVPDRPVTGPPPPPAADMMAGKPRLFVLTDIGNEPDDQMSMVRLMVYANEIDIEGLVAGTSVWQRSVTHPETLRAIVTDYGAVRPNLLKHAAGWPSAEQLLATISAGQPGYGMAAVGRGKSTPGSRALIQAADRKDDRPLWVNLWGGANTLAQALFDVRAARPPGELAAFVAKLRVYSISDQDDAGPWIRRTFPGLSYIVQPSSQNGDDYAAATWTGISGDAYYRNGDGADASLVSNEWLQSHVRSKGPLGRHYLNFAFIMEGDTPAFLNLIGNGLEGHRSPSWGGWGGRYVYRAPAGEAHSIWTQGGDAFARTDSRDMVLGVDGRTHVSDQATIWRWRSAYQNDFSARMDWTIKPFGQANHRPAVVVGGRAGWAPIFVDAKVGEPILLDASASTDPDHQDLRFSWFTYSEAGYSPGVGMGDLKIEGERTARAVLTPTTACRPRWLPSQQPCASGVVHVILAVTDTGAPALTSYRRIIVKITDPRPN
jgi:hypothetical protein